MNRVLQQVGIALLSSAIFGLVVAYSSGDLIIGLWAGFGAGLILLLLALALEQRRQNMESAWNDLGEWSLDVRLISFKLFVDHAGSETGDVQFDLELRNNSHLPIKYEVEKLDPTIGGRNLAEPEFHVRSRSIASGQTDNFRSPTIPRVDLRPSPVIGTVEVSLVYGTGGKTKFRQEKEIELRLLRTPSDQFPTQFDYLLRSERETRLAN